MLNMTYVYGYKKCAQAQQYTLLNPLTWASDKASKAHNQIILEDEMFWQNKLHMFDKIYGTIKWRIEATDSVMI